MHDNTGYPNPCDGNDTCFSEATLNMDLFQGSGQLKICFTRRASTRQFLHPSPSEIKEQLRFGKSPGLRECELIW